MRKLVWYKVTRYRKRADTHKWEKEASWYAEEPAPLFNGSHKYKTIKLKKPAWLEYCYI